MWLGVQIWLQQLRRWRSIAWLHNQPCAAQPHLENLLQVCAGAVGRCSKQCHLSGCRASCCRLPPQQDGQGLQSAGKLSAHAVRGIWCLHLKPRCCRAARRRPQTPLHCRLLNLRPREAVHLEWLIVRPRVQLLGVLC